MSTKKAKLTERHARNLHMGCCTPVKHHNRGNMHLIKFNMGMYYGSLSHLAHATFIKVGHGS